MKIRDMRLSGLMVRPFLILAPAFLTIPRTAAQSARELGLYSMVRINDSTFIDRNEVTVADMVAFSIEHPEMASPEKTMIGDLPYGPLFYGERTGKTRQVKGWAKDGMHVSTSVPEDSMRTKAQRYRAGRYMNYPIASITYEQAMAYCRWRTEQQLGWYRPDTAQVTFDLPALEEYQRLLVVRDSTNGRCSMFNYGCVPCQEQLQGKYAFIHPGSELTPTDGYDPDDNGLFNLRGNAAEMTSTRGIAKGGSYAHSARDAAPEAVQHYTGPEPWLGFRCVARIRQR